MTNNVEFKTKVIMEQIRDFYNTSYTASYSEQKIAMNLTAYYINSYKIKYIQQKLFEM